MSIRVNGVYPDFASIGLILTASDGSIAARLDESKVDIRAIDYQHAMDPKWLHLGGGYPFARSRGKYNAAGSIVWGMSTYNAVIALLQPDTGGGYGDVTLSIEVNYAPKGGDLITDLLYRCRIISDANSASVGGKEIPITSGLSIARIHRNKIASLTNSDIGGG